jgi:membrane fusion protein, multidrug efflux system
LGSRPEQETDDAYVQADMTPLSTRISGTVRKMEVEDHQSVKAGQMLVGYMLTEDLRGTTAS